MKGRILKILLLVLPLVFFWGFNHQNIPLQFSLLLGLLVSPYVIQPGDEKGGYRFLIIAVLFGFTLLFFRSSSMYFFLAGFGFLFMLEKGIGKLNWLPTFLLLIISPIVSNVVYIWSFPIRLELSKAAASLLSLTGMDIQANGNLILLNGNSFSVDPACIGLKMIVTSLVIGVVILAYFEKQKSKPFSFIKVSVYLVGILTGAIAANFIRLMTLVVFHILPENPLHDVVGILSLFAYVILPFFLLLKSLESTIEPIANKSNIVWNRKLLPIEYLSIAVILLFQIFTGSQFLVESTEQISSLVNINPDGFEREVTKKGVLKLQNAEALIYVKPPVKFFQGSHDPRFCWQGSGYTFSNVQIEKINGSYLYTATLSKAEDLLHTAWWYENNSQKTPHEWDWRWSSLLGKGGFYMININSSTKEQLTALINQENILKH